MSRNIKSRKAPDMLTRYFIEGTLTRLSRIEERLDQIEKKADAALDELQIREMSTRRRK
jgi:hypothetical protein